MNSRSTRRPKEQSDNCVIGRSQPPVARGYRDLKGCLQAEPGIWPRVPEIPLGSASGRRRPTCRQLQFGAARGCERAAQYQNTAESYGSTRSRILRWTRCNLLLPVDFVGR